MKSMKVLLLTIFTVFLLSVTASAVPFNAEIGIDLDGSLPFDAVESDADSDGIVTYNGSLGSWTFNTVIGATSPALNDEQLHLTSFNLSSNMQQDSSIWLAFSAGNFMSPRYEVAYGGVTNGIISEISLVANSDNLPLSAYANVTDFQYLGSVYNIGTGAFSGTFLTNAVDYTNPYSLWLIVGVDHKKGIAVTSLDIDVQPVPEPATMFLLGSGLVGLAGFGRKKFFKKG